MLCVHTPYKKNAVAIVGQSSMGRYATVVISKNRNNMETLTFV